jgi:hypothetical protein
MKKRLIIRSLIGLVVGALAVHAITLFVNYISRGEVLRVPSSSISIFFRKPE